MPTYQYRCLTCQAEKEDVRSVADRNKSPYCHGLPMSRVLTVPMAFVRPDISYTSPSSGKPINSRREHEEELARTGTIVYEPGIKQDQDRNERLRAELIERSIDATVEKEIATMPAAKRERLAAELDNGATAEVTRQEQ